MIEICEEILVIALAGTADPFDGRSDKGDHADSDESVGEKGALNILPIEKLIFFRFGRLSCEIIDQPNKDDFVRKYIRKDIKYKLTSFRIMFVL